LPGACPQYHPTGSVFTRRTSASGPIGRGRSPRRAKPPSPHQGGQVTRATCASDEGHFVVETDSGNYKERRRLPKRSALPPRPPKPQGIERQGRAFWRWFGSRQIPQTRTSIHFANSCRGRSCGGDPKRGLWPRRTGVVRDRGCGLRRTVLPRTRMNKGLLVCRITLRSGIRT
jgi:hypothetical protein